MLSVADDVLKLKTDILIRLSNKKTEQLYYVLDLFIKKLLVNYFTQLATFIRKQALSQTSEDRTRNFVLFARMAYY